MITIKKSAALKRDLRQDEPAGLSVPTWDELEKAIKEGKRDEALRLYKYARGESERNNLGLASFLEQALSYIAGLKDEELYKMIHGWAEESAKEWIDSKPTALDTLRMSTDSQRGHHASLSVKEEADRYVVTYNPCGTGGRMWRQRNLPTSKKPYPWTWSRTGVPMYCSHCCIKWEIVPTELRGFPLRINLRGERPEDPCVHLFYKTPEAIPEEYFTRIGKKKTIK
ncbi:MAG: hypothetical protein Q7R57_02390 [Dehalococcoidales bacterium]|nr:hypothetical protein [Dehalococcoidales bacterium]